MDVEVGSVQAQVAPADGGKAGQGGAGAGATAAVIVWNDLQVHVTDVKGNQRHILKGVTGYLEPQHLLAIMGPSGSGKSTLLDTLAGRLSRKVQRSGEILLNGHRSKLSYGVSAYVTQDEMLIGTLSVREHLQYVAQLRLCGLMPHQAKMERVEEVMSEMGLQVCGDTKIGNWHLKGISGGQKRRLAIASELVTHPTLLFLDEPTSGLDSASAFHVTSAVKQLAQKGRTILTVLHQPSSEVFELFDTLCLLSSGQVVYFGPLHAAEMVYTTAGLPCPSFRNPADHYLHCINRDFTEGSKASEVDDNMAALEAAYNTEMRPKVDTKVQELSLAAEPYGGNPCTTNAVSQTITLTRRMTLNFWRNLGVFWLRLGMYSMLCLCIGTIFFDLSSSWVDVNNRAAMLFFIVAFLTFMAISGFPAFEEDMQVFLRERMNGYYGVGSFVVANTLASAPFILAITIVSTLVVYWLAMLNDEGHRVPYFILDLYLSLLCVESLMMAIAAIVPHYLMGLAGGAGLLGMFMLVCGFFKPAGNLPNPVWRYPLHYMSFHTYAFTGFMHNEFEGTTGWACPCSINPQGCPTPCTLTGEQVLRTWSIADRSKWVDVGIIGGMSLLYRFFFFLSCKAAEWMKTS